MHQLTTSVVIGQNNVRLKTKKKYFLNSRREISNLVEI
jgi:hypothetical protein